MKPEGEAAELPEASALQLRDQLATGQRGLLGVTLEGKSCGLDALGKLCTDLNRLLRDVEKSREGKAVTYWKVVGAAFVEHDGGVLMHIDVGPGTKPKRTTPPGAREPAS